jgi:hypothetical protein
MFRVALLLAGGLALCAAVRALHAQEPEHGRRGDASMLRHTSFGELSEATIRGTAVPTRGRACRSQCRRSARCAGKPRRIQSRGGVRC